MRILLFISIFLFFSPESVSQDSLQETIKPVVVYDSEEDVEPMELDEGIIDEFKVDDDFDYTELEASESWFEQFIRWLGELWDSFWRWLLGDYEAVGILAFLIKILPYIIIAGIVFFVIWLFYKLNPGARLLKSKEAPEVFYTEEEEIIKSRNISDLIQKALEAKNYRLAIRYYYLLVLKKLSKAEIIHYEFDKTNREYVSEIDSEEISKRFSNVTNIYDYIWYGNFDVSESDFSIAQHSFNTLVNQIPQDDE
ncbi:DUF4129 domain-containing protein [Aureitalea sp. L0-47]|uniref:DUF4129 domain-containing protein n=1 Tax=Aureitalea sp. L0-47 TaxID=2816962 RepID=UPI00223758FC|nr:DUF4129 domain-containing protein [Aureitalea sp. L0-47]MCW5519793.1 DUF4129 domain-containing protein [Aureitalea sp. L0-47]